MPTKKKAVVKKQTIIGKMQTFDANRRIKVARSMARLADSKGIHTNKAKLQIARKSEKGLSRAIIKKNLAKHK